MSTRDETLENSGEDLLFNLRYRPFLQPFLPLPLPLPFVTMQASSAVLLCAFPLQLLAAVTPLWPRERKIGAYSGGGGSFVLLQAFATPSPFITVSQIILVFSSSRTESLPLTSTTLSSTSSEAHCS